MVPGLPGGPRGPARRPRRPGIQPGRGRRCPGLDGPGRVLRFRADHKTQDQNRSAERPVAQRPQDSRPAPPGNPARPQTPGPPRNLGPPRNACPPRNALPAPKRPPAPRSPPARETPLQEGPGAMGGRTVPPRSGGSTPPRQRSDPGYRRRCRWYQGCGRSSRRKRPDRREASQVHARGQPGADRAGHRRRGDRAAARSPGQRHRARCCRVRGQRRRDHAVRAEPGLARRAAEAARRGATRPRGRGGERRERLGLGRSAVRRRPRIPRRDARRGRNRDRGRHHHRRRAVPWPLGPGRRAGARPGGPGRAAVRLREPGLLGTVRERERPGRRGA